MDLQIVLLYYESIKRELQTRPINDCRCDERLKTKPEESTRLLMKTVSDTLGFFLDLLLIEKTRGRQYCVCFVYSMVLVCVYLQ
jgi:hypothetical protein